MECICVADHIKSLEKSYEVNSWSELPVIHSTPFGKVLPFYSCTGDWERQNPGYPGNTTKCNTESI